MSAGLAAADRPEAVPRGETGLWRSELDRMWARGRAFLGTDLAIMGGAMTWVSERHLVAAISNAGGFLVVAPGSGIAGMLGGESPAPTSAATKTVGGYPFTLHPQLSHPHNGGVPPAVGRVLRSRRNP